MYSVDLKNIVPKGGLTCLFTKATSDESKLWHRRLGHINFKTMNKLVKGNLVRGLPSKLFENNQTCVACQKGKQHRASCKSKIVSSISQPLHMLHMDLFGPTFVKSLMKKMYCLVVTDDYSRFSWVFFLATKDETSGILKSFITRVENLIDQRVKVIRCDNRTEFKNKEMNQFCERKCIKREFSVARTPQQNRVAERKNRTLIEAARTMLADSKLPTTFWAEAVNTACYVQNRVLVTKPHNKTPYELFLGRKPALGFMKAFGCLVAILNTINHLGKFDGTKACDDAGKARMETVLGKDYILLPFMVKNLDNVSGKFLMYPRFVQVFVNQQLEGMPTHKRIYIAPSHTKKIFGNMRRVGKGFSRRDTPLFQTMMVQDQEEVGEGSEMPTNPHHIPIIIQTSTSQSQKLQRSRRSKRKDTEVPQPSGSTDNVTDEAVYKELDDNLVRVVTTASCLEAEQDSGNIIKTRSKATPNEAGSQGTTSCGRLRRQDTMRDTIAQTRFENMSKTSNDSLLARFNTPRSDEDSMKELMEFCIKLQQIVLDLENTKITQA
ncbi:putative ribonuclease H-like domain-containing protein [Tanacetum coccineum]